MPKSKNHQLHNGERSSLIRISKIHVFIGLFLVGQIVAYDAAKLITPEAVLKRWLFTGGLILVAGTCWYLARLNDTRAVIRNLTWFLILADLAFASFSVYTQRGMASRAVLLFILPIIVAATMRRLGMIMLTATASAIIYTTTAVAYFVLNFNEGYKIELYGEIGFYAATLLAIGWALWALVRRQASNK